MITISLCMIVKNEEAVLARCLNSVRGIVDEIIIVDTGSNDRTTAIAKQFTNQIYHFKWRDDFAAARNFSFSKATKEYIMWLDADDVIEEESRKVFMDIKNTLSADTDAVMLPYHIAFDERNQPVFTSFRERLVRRERQFLWKEPVHECLVVSGHVKKLDAAICHRPGTRDEAHSNRNIEIYRSRLAAGEALSTRGMYYFARELKTHGFTEEAARWYEKVLQKTDCWVEDAISAAAGLADCYLENNRCEQALQALFTSFVLDLPRAEILCRIGAVYIQKNEISKAVYWYKQALELPKPEGYGFFNVDYWAYIPHMQLCMLYDRMGEHEKAFFHHTAAKQLHSESAQVLFNDAYFKSLHPAAAEKEKAPLAAPLDESC